MEDPHPWAANPARSRNGSCLSVFPTLESPSCYLAQYNPRMICTSAQSISTSSLVFWTAGPGVTVVDSNHKWSFHLDCCYSQCHQDLSPLLSVFLPLLPLFPFAVPALVNVYVFMTNMYLAAPLWQARSVRFQEDAPQVKSDKALGSQKALNP